MSKSDEIKRLVIELIGPMEQQEASDMTLRSWTNEDYKAFGRNELRAEIAKKVATL